MKLPRAGLGKLSFVRQFPALYLNPKSPGVLLVYCDKWQKMGQRRALLRGPATIHRDGGAGDCGGGVAAQEYGQGAEMLGGRELQHRLLVLEQVLLRLVDRDALLLG